MTPNMTPSGFVVAFFPCRSTACLQCFSAVPFRDIFRPFILFQLLSSRHSFHHVSGSKLPHSCPLGMETIAEQV